MQRSSALLALALVQLLLAYEWLASGLTKLVRGDFPSGLAAHLHDREHGTYGTFLRHVVVPHAAAFGWAIQVGELLVALLLVAGALCALTGRWRGTGLAATALGALAGALLTLNFGLFNGAHFLAGLAPDSFDEGVPLDVLATWLQLALVAGVVASLTARARRPA